MENKLKLFTQETMISFGTQSFYFHPKYCQEIHAQIH